MDVRCDTVKGWGRLQCELLDCDAIRPLRCGSHGGWVQKKDAVRIGKKLKVQ